MKANTWASYNVRHFVLEIFPAPRSMLKMRTEAIDHDISNNIGQGERGENFPTLVSEVVAISLIAVYYRTTQRKIKFQQ